ncbi:tetratricopeptide repeat protein [Flavobacteriales bacterium 34_180_T64]|nr:tetratricopeptide repeat protein [Flavobacteriales bacterium 34_180_T64]
MKTKTSLVVLFLTILISSCSKTIDYSPEFMEQTSGRYLYNQEEIVDVYYENKKLFIKWKGAEKIEPVVLDENVFFIVDMYKKLHFVQHPETKKRYMSVFPEDDVTKITYDYLKVDDSYKTPNMYLNDKEYDKALIGYLEIQKQDSTSVFLNESDFNSIGYRHLRKKEYKNAIDVFEMNVTLFPKSNNVYDSLAEAYLLSGDSLQAYTNYKQAYEYNTGNSRAKAYVDAYNK